MDEEGAAGLVRRFAWVDAPFLTKPHADSSCVARIARSPSDETAAATGHLPATDWARGWLADGADGNDKPGDQHCRRQRHSGASRVLAV